MRGWAFIMSFVVGGLAGALAWFVNELDLRASFYWWTLVGAGLGLLLSGLMLRRR